MSNVWRRFWEDESGQGLVEYVLILALITLLAVALLATIGRNMRNRLEDVANCLEVQPGEDPPADCPSPDAS